MRVEAPTCPNPLCGSRMIRVYCRTLPKIDNREYKPVGWMCTCCGVIRKDKNNWDIAVPAPGPVKT